MAKQHEKWPKEGTPKYKLLKYAEKQGWSDMALGEISGAGRTAISNYRNSDKHDITLPMAVRIAKNLGINMLHLLDPEVHEIPLIETGTVTLSEDEAEVLRIAKRIGIQRAIDRLYNLPDEATQEEGGGRGRAVGIRTARMTPEPSDEPKGQDNPARKLTR